MSSKFEQLERERQSLLSELQSIDRLRRGSLSRQVYHRQKDGQDRSQGPYYVLQGYRQGKKFSQRVPAAQVEQVRQQVDNFKCFQPLADRCITLTDQITQWAQGPAGSKKNSGHRRSNKPVSRKPKPS